MKPGPRAQAELVELTAYHPDVGNFGWSTNPETGVELHDKPSRVRWVFTAEDVRRVERGEVRFEDLMPEREVAVPA